jgi:hypothetical protein
VARPDLPVVQETWFVGRPGALRLSIGEVCGPTGQHVARNTMMIMANQIGGAVTTDLCSRRIDRWFRDMGAGRDEILAEAAGSGGCLVRLAVHPRGHELVAAWDVDHGRWPRR